MIDKFIDELKKSFETGNFVVPFIVEALVFVVKGGILFHFLEKWKRKRFKHIGEMLANPLVDGSARLHLVEALNTEAFRITTKIYAEKVMRGKIIELVELANGEITMRDMRHARMYFSIKKGELEISVKWPQYIDMVGNGLIGFLFLAIGLYWFVLQNSSQNMTFYQSTGATLVSIFFVLASSAYFYEASKFATAKRILKMIKKIDQSQSING